jgi:soluble lytic murein transglycosylase-like protein
MKFANENTWNVAIAAAAAAEGLPMWVVKTTIAKESSFNPRAFKDEPEINDASRGLMQVLYSTAKWLGYSGPAGDDNARAGGLYDPETSIRIGAHYLGYLARRWRAEGWDAIYAAYNSGAVRRDSSGFITSKGASIEGKVQGWRDLADYFNPNWRTQPRGPFVQPAAAPAPAKPARRRKPA